MELNTSYTSAPQRGVGRRVIAARRPVPRAGVVALGAVLLGIAAGGSVSVGPFWAGWVLLVALLAGYALLRSTLFGLCSVLLVITLLPFGALPFKFTLTPTFLELALLALLGIWLLRLLATPEYELRFSVLGGPVLLFLGFTIFSLVIGANGIPDNLTLHNYVKFALGVLLFFSVLNTILTRHDVRWAIRVLLLGGTSAALLGIGLLLLNDQSALNILTALGRIGYPTTGRVLRYVEDDPNGVERAIGTSVDPNSFGGMLSLVSGMALALIWARRPLFPRTAILLQAGAMAVCILLTQSRGALGGLLVAAAFVAIVRDRRMWYVLAAAAAAGILAYAVLGIGGSFVARAVAGAQFQDQANQMRLAEYQNALEIIRRYPIFGVGFGEGPELGLITGVSSIYLAMAERIGLLGLGAFVVTMALFFTRSLGTLRSLDEERQTWLVAVQAGLVAALAGGLLDHYFFNIEFSHMVALFWGVTGLGVAVLYLRDEAEPVTSSSSQ